MTNRGGSSRALIASMSWALGVVSCAEPNLPVHRPEVAPTFESWRRATRMLSAIERASSKPRTMRVSLALREPISRRTLEARGAIALAPPEALRMILLGPGGTTSLDLWLRGDQFRFAVPAIDLLRRGDASTPRKEMRGMPVDFLRWWLLRPTAGQLLWHVEHDTGSRFVLRDGSAIIDLNIDRSGHIVATRTTWENIPDKPNGRRKVDEERVEAERWGCGEVQYRQASTNLRVTVKCETEESERPPNPRAFLDPDKPDAMLILGRRFTRD